MYLHIYISIFSNNFYPSQKIVMPAPTNPLLERSSSCAPDSRLKLFYRFLLVFPFFLVSDAGCLDFCLSLSSLRPSKTAGHKGTKHALIHSLASQMTDKGCTVSPKRLRKTIKTVSPLTPYWAVARDPCTWPKRELMLRSSWAQEDPLA